MDALKQEKLHRFLSATKFAVVGASNDTSKYGFKVDFKWLIDRKKDAVPVNLKPGEILGIKCFQSLSQLPDPTHTAVVIVVPPKATLDVLQQAKDLNMFACWVQPGAENDDVVKFIQADAELEAKSLYDGAALHVLAGSKIVTPKTTPTCPGIISQGSEILDTVKVAAVNLVRVDAAPIRTLEDKKRLFLSAHKFAVVGASANSSKNGAKVCI
ncbi:hypothetical protein C8F01DRAFT_977505 [Mycena amicta]|nr:hypothetical protein C8F01DRAFT_977505 [Mycena amicta]